MAKKKPVKKKPQPKNKQKTVTVSKPGVVKKKVVIDMTRFTKETRIDKLITLFKNHIGIENQISAYALFRHIFGLPRKYSELQIYYLWNILKQDMNYLRRKTFCFIGSHWNGDTWVYYVVKTMDDADPYIDRMITHIKRCTYMKERCKKAVKEEFWRQL